MNFTNTYPIAITGCIASGKSTAIKIINNTLQLNIICADNINKQLIKKKIIIKKITEKFGNNILINNKININNLKKIIIKSPESKKWLEKYLHPLINKEIKKK